MNTTHRRIAWLAVLFTLCVSGTASAQTAPATNPWSHGTTLNVFAGVNSASSQIGSLAGGAVGWEVSRWTDIQAKVVRHDARSYVLATVAVHLAYHVETHPVAQGHR